MTEAVVSPTSVVGTPTYVAKEAEPPGAEDHGFAVETGQRFGT
jgi:hypothetical protein